MLSRDLDARVFESARTGLLLLETATGRVLEVNRAFLRMAAREPGEVVGRNFWEPPLIADPRAGAEVHKHLRMGGAVDGVELPLQTSGGEWRLLEVCGGPAAGVTLIEVRDASARERARLAERMKALRQLSGWMSGEFHNLHGTLRMIGELLVAASGQNRPIMRELEEVRQATERAGALSGQLAAFSGKLAMDPRPIALNNLLQSMLPRLRQLFGRDIEIVYDLSPDLEPVMADPAQLRQIILKLATNSRDAMDRAGTFCVQTRNAAAVEPCPDGTAVDEGPFVMLAVSDNGPGFDDTSWAHLFEPFFKTKPNGRGLGLGLASIHGIVRKSGGHLWAYSQPGKGATFRIYLPQAKLHFPALLARQPGDVPDGGATILLVEPNDRLRTIMANLLKRQGYRVLAALHPQEALRTVEAQGPPDLLIGHPDPDLANHLARMQPDLKMVCLVGHSDDLEAHSSRVAILHSPFEPENLLETVQDLLGK